MDAEAWNQRYAGAEPVWSAGPNMFVERELAALRPGSAVELAAGEGRNAIWLASRGWKVTAVDFADVGLDRGRKRPEGANVEWVCADVTTWAVPEPVDLVVVTYLQLPAEDRARAVATAWDGLRSHGTLLWVAHDSANLAEGVGGPQDPEVLMTADDLLGDLDELPAAYEIVSAGRVERHTPQGTALDCLVRVVKD